MVSNGEVIHSGVLDGINNNVEPATSDLQPLGNLGTMNLSGCENLKEIPDLSEATSLRDMRLNSCKSLVTLPSSIGHLVKLNSLEMENCTSLEFLPTNINLASLRFLYLNGCTRLTSFPQLSTSIERLYLDDTAIEEVPSWIENISTLKVMTMRGCTKLRKISATIKNLTCGFHPPEIDKAVSYANLLEIVEEVHPASIQYYAENLVSGSYSAAEFLLARSAQDYILQTDFRYVVLPGKQVPTYFPHRTRGRSLILPLSESSLSKKRVGFAGCLSLDLRVGFAGWVSLDLETDYITIIVHWKFKGVTGICRVTSVTETWKRDHQVVFHFDFDNGEEIDDPPSHFDCNNVEFEFEVHCRPANYCRCYHLSGTKDRNLETCPFFTQVIKECGIRVMGVSPPLNADETSSEPKSREEIDPAIRNWRRKMMVPYVTLRMLMDDFLYSSE